MWHRKPRYRAQRVAHFQHWELWAVAPGRYETRRDHHRRGELTGDEMDVLIRFAFIARR